MSDLGNLQQRVGDAVDKLLDTQHQRQRHNQSLGRVLNDLEIKFEARKIELDHCHGRIRQLEESNKTLTELVSQMVEIVERTADEVGEDPVYRTTAVATDILERYVPDQPANDGAVKRDATGGTTGENRTTGYDAPADAFQDVDADLLKAEKMFEKVEGGEYPRLVHDAVELARADGAEPVAADAAADPSPVTETNPAEKDLGIKEIMARLEIAAERSQLGSQAAEDDQASDDIGRVAGSRG